MATAANDSERHKSFFGRRKGHRLRTHQAGLMHTLLPRLALDLATPAPADMRALFSSQVEAARLEIGFGGGEHLVAEAKANPAIGFIGCEPFINGMAKALALIEATGCENVRLHLGDAIDVIDWAPPASFARIDLLYPDPWPKRRHWKRRFVQDQSLGKVANALQPDGEFHFASDIADYAAWTLERALRAPGLQWTAERAIDWTAPWPGFVETRYEAKAKREGRKPCYLVFRRKV
jgi:tRNA (guanine-N7-)-methyltransferase